MKLDEYFDDAKINDFTMEFLNVDLRDFMNTKEDGTMDYRPSDMKEKDGWKEVLSYSSQMHQSTTDKYLHSKWFNKDGREVVFKFEGIRVTDRRDYGAY